MRKVAFILILLGFHHGFGKGPDEKVLRLDDHVYEYQFKTVLFYQEKENANTDMIYPPIIPLGSANPLVLEFDELVTEYHNYYLKIIHCNADWSKSMLADMEFLFEYNEYLTDRYNIASATNVPYIHYRFVLPPVKVSGNFIAKVYREGNEKDVVITRKFMVYSSLVNINANINFSDVVQYRNEDQQLNMAIRYSGLTIYNPRDELKVLIRQNYRTETQKSLKPLFINESDQILEYNYFDGENTFMGWNEFRTFDARSLLYLGLHVAQVNLKGSQPQLILEEDQPRWGAPYTQLPDINGAFAIESSDTKRTSLDPDYVWVTFTLLAEKPYEGKVYIFGGLSDWRQDLNCRMSYLPETKRYTATLQLKQGFYNYNYLLDPFAADKRAPHIIEGNHSQTTNNYEIFVYTRFLGKRNDELIGYRLISHLGRN